MIEVIIIRNDSLDVFDITMNTAIIKNSYPRGYYSNETLANLMLDFSCLTSSQKMKSATRSDLDHFLHTINKRTSYKTHLYRLIVNDIDTKIY